MYTKHSVDNNSYCTWHVRKNPRFNNKTHEDVEEPISFGSDVCSGSSTYRDICTSYVTIKQMEDLRDFLNSIDFSEFKTQ